MILIDSDILIEIYDRRSKDGEAAFRKISRSGDTFCITAINLHEVLYGLLKYAKPSEYLMQLPVMPYSKDDARLAAELEFRSESKGRRLARTDARLAAIAINHNARLYTNNRRRFSAVDGLELL